MRIGIVCYPTFGGSGVVATELGIALAEKGHVVHFITYDRPVRLPHAHANGRTCRRHQVAGERACVQERRLHKQDGARGRNGVARLELQAVRRPQRQGRGALRR